MNHLNSKSLSASYRKAGMLRLRVWLGHAEGRSQSGEDNVVRSALPAKRTNWHELTTLIIRSFTLCICLGQPTESGKNFQNRINTSPKP
jgi:hypothetical protein